jgi:hypothetical protein
VSDYRRIFDTDRGFWRWAVEAGLPIAITEGWKKALALVEHGIPAIALRGVTCWHPKGSPELWPELAAFATAGRSVYIVFDADTKEKAIRNVSREIKKLGRAMDGHGCKVSVVGWEPELGKGIDDVLVAKGDEAERWLNQKIATAATFEEWNKRNLKSYRLRVWRYLRSTGIEPERITTGQYLPELPELEQGAIHVVTAPMGSGKTERLKDWVQSGYFALCLSPLNSLGKQSAERWELPHRHDCGNTREQQEAFRLLVREAGGVDSCVDSLSRLQEFIDESTPLLMVLDEVDQVLESLNLGGTLGERQAETLETFAANLQIAARNGAIVLSEACVSRRSIQQIHELSGCSKVRYFQHHGESQPWTVSLSSGGTVDNFAYELVNTVGNGKKVILTVSSQNQGEKLERLVNELYPNKRTLRIDSKTNEAGAFDQFWLDPDSYLSRLPELPDLLVLSPSAKSGVSITVPGFDQVWGLFTCHSPSSWAQQLGRYRLPVERFVFCPALIPASTADEGYCSVRAVERRLQADLTGFARVYDLAAALDQDEQAAKIAQSQRDFYSAHQTAIGIEKAYPRDCLSEILSEQGHAVIGWIPTGSLGAGALARIQREIWRDEAELFAEARPDFDLDEAKKRLGSSELTRKGRAEALKVLYRDEFPGIDFDDPADCYAALTENFGRLRRGVLLQVQAANLDATKRQSSQQVEAILRRRVQLAHRLPKSFFRAALIKQLGLLELLDGNPYQESDERVIQIKTAALHWAKEIYKNFTLSIRADQTGIEIANKLLRKLGLKAEVLRKIGPRGQQVKIWGLPNLCSPIRVRLLRAATKRIGGDSDSILIKPPQAFHDAKTASSAEPEPTLPPSWTDWTSAINDARTKAQKLGREDIQGATALLKQISQYPGQWQVTVWTLIKNLPGGWAINRAIKQCPDLTIGFGPLASQPGQVSIQTTQVEEAVS